MKIRRLVRRLQPNAHDAEVFGLHVAPKFCRNLKTFRIPILIDMLDRTNDESGLHYDLTRPWATRILKASPESTPHGASRSLRRSTKSRITTLRAL